ncbi:Glycosyltransferase like family 2 [Hymenobacter gelipurpurascens]|uniref:Glycosyltransferase like family 2 n=1 Tax=Hymenobacter gelipurpurascens TaxID=89968 RepID=A0A212TRT8_9BACT|nr:glycosyltransferase [Hymenobacter gelipurpurascens]SNC68581.1 Glycosyltransferase like family 2 [Hymenobacter gelipurpurascens]
MNSALPSLFHAVQENTAAALLTDWVRVPVLPKPGLQAVVIIPAKDEAENLPATLAALAAQTTLEGLPLDHGLYEIVVLANNCHDATAEVARQFGRQHPTLALHILELTLPPQEAHVGKARRLLMDEACRRLEQVETPGSFIASTDADTRVAPTWLAATQAALAQGADAVGGRILTDTVAYCPVRRRQLQDATYHLLRVRLEALLDPVATDPWPRHHQHFGASFALTPKAYRRVGGLPIVPYLEDEALYQALLRHDLCLRHSPEVRVYTSNRQQGRVAVGLSWQLRQWATLHEAKQEPLVDNPARLVAEWQIRGLTRRLWQGASASTLPLLSKQLGLSVRALEHQLCNSSTFGHLWQWVLARWEEYSVPRGYWPPLPLSEAIACLRRELAAYELRISQQAA